MEYSLENANEFISINAKKVNKSYRLKFHMMPPIGWMNDPNGLIKYKEQYHIIYHSLSGRRAYLIPHCMDVEHGIKIRTGSGVVSA